MARREYQIDTGRTDLTTIYDNVVDLINNDNANRYTYIAKKFDYTDNVWLMSTSNKMRTEGNSRVVLFLCYNALTCEQTMSFEYTFQADVLRGSFAVCGDYFFVVAGTAGFYQHQYIYAFRYDNNSAVFLGKSSSNFSYCEPTSVHVHDFGNDIYYSVSVNGDYNKPVVLSVNKLDDSVSYLQTKCAKHLLFNFFNYDGTYWNGIVYYSDISTECVSYVRKTLPYGAYSYERNYSALPGFRYPLMIPLQHYDDSANALGLQLFGSLVNSVQYRYGIGVRDYESGILYMSGKKITTSETYNLHPGNYGAINLNGDIFYTFDLSEGKIVKKRMEEDVVPNNEILYVATSNYTSSTRTTLSPQDTTNTKVYDNKGNQLSVVSTINSNDGWGHLKFSGDIYKIGSGAFSGNTTSRLIRLPNSVGIIEDDAFCNNTSLDNIMIQKRTKVTVRTNAFRGCTHLISKDIITS